MRIKLHDAPFHIYILRRPDGTPFYVGKGGRFRARIARHEAQARTLKRSRKLSIIRGIWRAGCSVQYEVSSFHQEEREAFAEEIRLIASFGRIDTGTGILTNRTDGGDGPSGYSHTESAKQKMRSAFHAERREKNSVKMKAQNACPLFRQARERARIPAVVVEQKRPERRAAQSAKMKEVLAANKIPMDLSLPTFGSSAKDKLANLAVRAPQSAAWSVTEESVVLCYLFCQVTIHSPQAFSAFDEKLVSDNSSDGQIEIF